MFGRALLRLEQTEEGLVEYAEAIEGARNLESAVTRVAKLLAARRRELGGLDSE